MSIFKDIKIICAYSGLGSDQFVKIAGQNVPRSFIRWLITMLSIVIIMLESVLCVKFLISNDLSNFLMSGAIMMLFLPILPIYISLVMKTKKIDELFSCLENVIKKSNANLLLKMPCLDIWAWSMV